MTKRILARPSGDRTIGLAIWSVNSLTIAANVCIYLLCASAVVGTTGSVLLGSLVFSLQWLLPIFLGPVIHRINDRFAPRSVLCGCILLCAIASFGVLALDLLVVAFAVSTILGGAETVLKVTRLVALKAAVSPENVRSLVAFTGTGQFAGAALGGVLFAAGAHADGFALVGILVAVQAASLASAWALPRDRVRGSSAAPGHGFVTQVWATLGADPVLMRGIVCLVATVGLLQGFHNVVRVNLPVQNWSATPGQIGALQLAIAVATIAGALAYSRFPNALSSGRATAISALLSTALMVATAASHDANVSLALYAAYIFFFEVLFMRYQADVVSLAKEDKVAMVVSAQYMLINMSMMSLILVGGALAEAAGFVATAALYGSALIAILAIVTIRTNRLGRSPSSPKSRRRT